MRKKTEKSNTAPLEEKPILNWWNYVGCAAGSGGGDHDDDDDDFSILFS